WIPLIFAFPYIEMPDLEFPFVPYPYLIKLIITFFSLFSVGVKRSDEELFIYLSVLHPLFYL
ncbi:hypothetical protein, partial [Vibrio parahaemolyticus]|uniref:hypothetical protein n=1 Tax=Vibrio parahaemolyticus TaxID=670 RepID=UPI001C5FF2F2